MYARQSKTVKAARTPWTHNMSRAALSNPFYTHFTQNWHFYKLPLSFNRQKVLRRWETEKKNMGNQKNKNKSKLVAQTAN